MTDSTPEQEIAPETVAAESPAPVAGAIHHAEKGRSFGEVAWDRFKRNRQAVAGGLIVLFMTTCGVFAPLIANSLPYFVESKRPDLYENAFAIVWFDTYNEIDAIADGDADAFTQAHRDLATENLALMETLLVADDLDGIRELGPKIERLLAAEPAGPDETDALLTLLEENEEQFDSFSADLDFAVLSSWPAFRALMWGEVFFMTAFILLAVGLPLRGVLSAGLSRLPKLGDNPRFVDAMGGVRGIAFVALALAGLAAFAWARAFPPRHDGTDYKALQANGRVERVVFPLIPYGENENIFEDRKMYPFWRQYEPEEAARLNAEIATATEAAGESSESASAQDLREIPERRIRPVWRIDENGEPVYRKHWLGTDATGRDLAARMVYGARIAMSIGIVAVSIYVAIGLVIGSLAGFFGGWVDLVVSRFIEIMICFPTFFLILIIISFVGQSIFWVMVIIGLTGWTGVARLTRGEFMRLSGLDFVQSVRATGGSSARIIFRHVLPNAIQPVLVSASFGIAAAILIESSLSYLGFGVQPPFASWGQLLHEAQDDVKGMWWMTVFPGLAILATVTAFNLVGEATRDALDPKMIDPGK